MEQEITYNGLKKLDSFEIIKVQTLTNRFFPKLKRHFANAVLKVNVKKDNTAGKRSRYTVVLRVLAPETILSVEHADWELQRAVHRAFDGLENEARHKFKVDGTKRRKKNFGETTETE